MVYLKEHEGKSYELVVNDFTGKSQIKIDGMPAVKLSRKQFTTTNDEGEQTIITLAGNVYSGFYLIAGSSKIVLSNKQAIYLTITQVVLAIAMVTSIILSGILGGLISVAVALIGTIIVTRPSVAKLSTPIKIAICVLLLALMAGAVTGGVFISLNLASAIL